MTASDPRLSIRALVETFIPGPPHDPAPGAADVEAERFVHEIVGRMGDEAVTGLVAALDGCASAVSADTSFSHLSLDDRSRALHVLGGADAQLVRTLFGLTLAAFYGEWSGLRDGRLERRPPSWDQVGYPGPSTGYA